MGYQDNSTITVDAILTKQGRKRIAEGKTLDVAYFSLTDNGVSYTLYNTAHPSGSAFYGEAIENLPQLEALPQAEYSMMRNNLVTLNKGTTAMPVITDVPNSHTFGANRTTFTFSANIMNHAEPNGFRMFVRDINRVPTMMGEKNKKSLGKEIVFKKLGKSIIINKNLKKGSKLRISDLDGKIFEKEFVPIRETYKFINKKLKKDLVKDQPLMFKDI